MRQTFSLPRASNLSEPSVHEWVQHPRILMDNLAIMERILSTMSLPPRSSLLDSPRAGPTHYTATVVCTWFRDPTPQFQRRWVSSDPVGNASPHREAVPRRVISDSSVFWISSRFGSAIFPWNLQARSCMIATMISGLRGLPVHLAIARWESGPPREHGGESSGSRETVAGCCPQD